ncbi:MAG: hypothetical protein WKG00_13395 [Polyangiaceae bacterium]
MSPSTRKMVPTSARPTATPMAVTSSKKGKASRMSTTRMSTVSTRAARVPAYQPAARPTAVPTMVASAVAAMATPSDRRAPWASRARTSRKSTSVPSQCCHEALGGPPAGARVSEKSLR